MDIEVITDVKTDVAKVESDGYESADELIEKRLQVEELFDELKDTREIVDETKSEIPDDQFETEKNDDSIFDEESEKRKSISIGLKNKLAKGEAKILTRVNDSLNSFICSLIADDDPDKFKANKTDLKDIEDVIYDFRKESDKHLPAWLQIALFIGATYGPLYKSAFDMRKLNKRNAILEAENKLQQQQIASQNNQVVMLMKQFLEKQESKNNVESEKNESEKNESNAPTN